MKLNLLKQLCKKIKWLVLILTVIILFLNSSGSIIPVNSTNPDKTDSLLIKLKTLAEDTNKVNLLNDISYKYLFSDPKSGIIYGKKGIQLSEKLGFTKGKSKLSVVTAENYRMLNYYDSAIVLYKYVINTESVYQNKLAAKSYFGLGYIEYMLSDYQSSLNHFKNALTIYEKFKNKPKSADCYNFIGLDYSSLCNYPQSLENLQKAAVLYDEINEKSGTANVFVAIGTLYNEISDFDKALEYYLKALSYYKDMNNEESQSVILNNIGMIYCSNKKYNDALEYFEKALVISNEYHNNQWIASQTANIGETYSELLNYSKALEYFNKSLKISDEIGYKSLSYSTYNNIGLVYLKMVTDSSRKDTVGNRNLLLNSIDFFNKSLLYFKNSGEKIQIERSFTSLYRTYVALGDYKTALEYYIKSTQLHDSIYSGENKKIIASLEAKRENELKEKEIEILKQKNQIQELNIGKQSQEMLILEGREKIQNMDLQNKKDELVILKKDQELTKAELLAKKSESEQKQHKLELLTKEKKYQSIVSKTLVGGLILTSAVILLLFLFFRKKIRDNRILAEKNKTIEEQKNILEEANRIINEDIEKAAEYVFTLLPEKFKYNEIATDWKFIPSSLLGGDAFGYHWIDKENFAFYILDVCGHGIGAALHSISILNTIHSHKQISFVQKFPDKVIDFLNKTFAMEKHNGLFFTMWYGVYNLPDRILKYSSAGHPAPILIEDGNTITKLGKPALAVGCLEEINYYCESIKIKSNAAIYLFSDGAYEISKPNGTMMNTEDFYMIIHGIHSKNNGYTLEALHKQLISLQNSEHFEDDFSILKILLV